MTVPVIIVLVLAMATAGGIGLLLGRRGVGVSSRPDAAPSSERMDLLRERLETVMDAARGAERETADMRARLSTMADDVDMYKKQLGGRYGSLTKRVQDIEALTQALALHQSGGASDSTGSAGAGAGAGGDGDIRQMNMFDPSTQVR